MRYDECERYTFMNIRTSRHQCHHLDRQEAHVTEEIYKRLAKVLDTLPNGFPPTDTGVELKILKKIFEPHEAELFCELRLSFETAEQIAQRTGRPLQGLPELLHTMWKKGQIFAVNLGGTWIYKMLPWAFGIYEFQLPRLDRELCELIEQYWPAYGNQFFATGPQLMQVLPVQKELHGSHSPLPYEQVSCIIENGHSFAINECICKKERALMDEPCPKPLHVCMAIAPIPGFFERSNHWGKAISKEEAYRTLARAEQEALVHLTWNTQTGHMFICNCCSCCCGILRSINVMGMPASKVVNAHYFATIHPELCTACGICAQERCQVNAIEASEDVYRIMKDRCIGCGLCVGTCPAGAIELVRKDDAECEIPPVDEMDWYEQRSRRRGVDFSAFK